MTSFVQLAPNALTATTTKRTGGRCLAAVETQEPVRNCCAKSGALLNEAVCCAKLHIRASPVHAGARWS